MPLRIPVRTESLFRRPSANGIHGMHSKMLEQLQAMEAVSGAAFVRELLDLFLSECEVRFGRIEAALPGGDLAGAQRHFHLVQGSAASMGATHLRRISALGEEACRQGDHELAVRSYRLSTKALGQLKPFISNWRPG